MKEAQINEYPSFNSPEFIEATARGIELWNALDLTNTKQLTREEAKQCKALGKENIIGIGYGIKSKNGKPTKALAAILYVIRKAPTEEVIPEYLAETLVKKYFGEHYASDVQER